MSQTSSRRLPISFHVQRKNGHYLVAILLLWLLFAQTTFEARHTSLTTDEPLHIISGYSFLKTGDPRLVEEHPLLIKSISAWPLTLSPDLGDPRQTRGWPEAALVTVTRAMLLRYPAIDRLTFAARVPVMWLGVILAALVYRWAADWRRVGPKAGLVALALCVLDPNIVAHAQLATTDVGVTMFLFAAWYVLWRWIRRSSFTRLVLTGLLIGSALASKMSTLITLPLIALVVCAAFAKRQPDGWRGALLLFGQAIASLIAIFTIAALVVWATYGFELRWLPGLPVPIPAASHLIPLARLFEHQRAGQSTFVLGRNSQMGWWYYFPVAFAIKTPLPTLILLVGAAISLVILTVKLWRTRRRAELGRTTAQATMLLIFPIVYFVSALFSTVDIGYRHVLPILPFLFAFIGGQVTNCRSLISNSQYQIGPLKFRIWHLILGVLGFWYASGSMLNFPRPLEYFNELAGGPANGYKYLVDSNLDWGQSFKELKQYLDARGVKHIQLSAMMFLEPSVYGLDYDPIPPSRKSPDQLPSRFNPEPGVYVISATSLQGVATPDINTYAFFRSMTPTARIGNALFVYDVPQALPGEWIAQCVPPVAPLEREDIASGFGRELQRVYLDCAQSWWYPAQATPGWYTHSTGRGLDWTEWYRGAQAVVRARTADGQPQFEIVHVEQPAPPDGLITVARTEQGTQITAPVRTTGPLTFEGFWPRDVPANARPGEQVTILTAWRVTSLPSQPVSILAHLVSEDEQTVAVGDGLGVPIEVWQIGDTIVQAHSIEIPMRTVPGAYWIETGVYRLDNMERYHILEEGQTVGDRLLLAPIEVKP